LPPSSIPGIITLMTAGQKTNLANFLDLSSDYLKDGYRRPREAYSFTDDPSGDPPAAPDGEAPPIPLAYLVDENDADDSLESSTEAAGRGSPLEQIAVDIAACTACPLSNGRANAVSGEGVSRPLVMVIGEGPGAGEDASGRPFVGKAGQLLDKMLASVGLSREKNCFIANVVKCRPPENRDPEAEEVQACTAFLERQINLLEPKIILCAGRTAARHILHTEEGINRLRGRFGEYPAAVEITETESLQSSWLSPIPVLPTYHPSALLRDESLKRPAFKDLKLLMAKLVSLDSDYARDTKPLLKKYAAADADFAAKVREYLD
jgi:DNA polymerase